MIVMFPFYALLVYAVIHNNANPVYNQDVLIDLTHTSRAKSKFLLKICPVYYRSRRIWTISINVDNRHTCWQSPRYLAGVASTWCEAGFANTLLPCRLSAQIQIHCRFSACRLSESGTWDENSCEESEAICYKWLWRNEI